MTDQPTPTDHHPDFLEETVLDKLCEGYQHQGFSDLTITKYRYLVQKGSPFIHSQLPGILNPKQGQFITQVELHNLDKSILKKMESFPRERMSKNNSHHSFKRSSADRSINQFSTENVYGPKDEVAFRLDHNRYQMRIQKQQELSIVESLSKTTIPKKLPKIKSYPSRLNDDGQLITTTIKSKVAEVVSDNTIPTYNLSWVDRFYSRWRPPMREAATINNVAGKFYLYGGISGTPFNDMSVWDGNEWIQIEVIGEKPTYGRTNHCASVYRRCIYYFGGEKPYDGQQKIRESLNDFRIFNTENNEFKMVRISGEGVEGRRGAASCFVGKHYLILGGITTKGTYPNDMFHMEISTQRLAVANLENPNFFAHGIAFHTMVSAFNSTRVTQLYKSNLDSEEQKEHKQRVEGVYVFGGENKQGQLYSGLYLLNTFQRPMCWAQVNTKGVSPCPRYKHTCTYFERQSMLVVYGGISEDSLFLNDCHIYRIDTQTWCNINMEFREGRSGHCSAIDDHKLLVFGGYNQRGFVAADVTWLELDQLSSIRTQRQAIQSMNTSKNEKINEQKKKQVEENRLMRLREQIESLSFKNIRSFAPMPLVRAKSQKSQWGKVQQKKDILFALKMHEETQHLMQDLDPIEESSTISKGGRSLTMKNFNSGSPTLLLFQA